MLLTKSDFKVARTCPTKLYYRKRKYPTTLEDNEYLEFLADGGFMVEALAHLHFPRGVEMPFQAGVTQAAQQTAEAFEGTQSTIFEGTFVAGRLMARVDILDRQGSVVRIIEVKAKSIDTSIPLGVVFCSRNGIRPGWRPYLEDVAFQTLVLRRLYPSSPSYRFCACLTKARQRALTCCTSTSLSKSNRRRPKASLGDQRSLLSGTRKQPKGTVFWPLWTFLIGWNSSCRKWNQRRTFSQTN